MPSPPAPVLAAIVVVVITVVVTIIFFATQGGGGSPPSGGSPVPGPAQAPSPSALQRILQGSQTLQGPEVEASTTKAITFTPPAEPVAYTMAFRCKIDAHGGSWREIWRRQGNGPDAPTNGPGWNRDPCFYISGNDDGNGAGHLHYIHASTTDWNTHTYSGNFKATPGTFFHFAVTVDQASKKITAYVNGVLEPSKTPTNDTTTGTFKWGNQDFFNINVNPGVHIKDWYFIPKVLSASEIATLAAAPASSPGTSTYLPEPYDDSSDTAFY